MGISIPPIAEEELMIIQREVQKEEAVQLSDWQTQSMINRIRQLESVVQALLSDVVPHSRDTGHNAADRDMAEAIKAARAALPTR